MSRNNDELNGVTLLGNQNTKYDYDYNPGVLETFVNKHPDNDYIVTFDAYEFTSLCVTGDTLIETARDESQYPSGIPIKDLVGTTGYVFGFDINSETPVCRKYYDVRKTQENAPIVKITLDCIKRDKESDNNIKHETSYLRCTPNHLILVKTGFHKYEWIQAKDLQPNMHLVHFDALKKSTLLLTLNHKVISVENDGFEDVYNMEVEDVHNFFANDVVIHNCPKTGQPDFAKVIINYIPNQLMVESKSLKLYLFSFRNHGDFHEDCMNIVMKDLINLMDPKYIEVKGIFAPRGGISIYPFVNWANPKFEYNEFVKQRQLENMKDTCNRTNRYDL